MRPETILHIKEVKQKKLDRIAQIQSEVDALNTTLPLLGDEPLIDPTQPNRRISFGELSYRVIKEAGRPLHRSAVVEGVLDRGRIIRGKDPRRTITAHMRGDPRIVPKGNGFWGLAEWEETVKECATTDSPAGRTRRVPLCGRDRRSLEVRTKTPYGRRDSGW